MAQGWADAGRHTLPGLLDERLGADPDGPFLDCCGTLLTGGRAALSRRFSVSGFWPQINAAGATIASLLGSLAVLVARGADTPLARGSGAAEANTTLRLLTGAPIPPEIDDLIRRRFGVETFSNATAPRRRR